MIQLSHTGRLADLSISLEELFMKVSACGRGAASMPPELADEIATTAGEIMVELACYRGEELVRGVIEDARRLREVVRTIRPEAVLVEQAGRALAKDLTLVIRNERHAA